MTAMRRKKVAEREGLIRFAQGFAPKPAALPMSLLRNRCAIEALLRIARQ
jgi:hypothetical protein